MVERRSPLVLSSTRATLRSVLNSFRPDEIPGRPDSIRRSVRLPAGVLRWKRDGVNDSKFDSLDDSSLVGLSTQLLKRLSINSGSFVVINNIDIGIQRVAQVVVLDPPNKTLEDSSVTSLPVSDSLHTMLVFPTFDTMSQQLLDQEVAYLSPMLAFNLSLHMSCLKSLVHRGNEVLEKYFVAKFDEESASVAGESKIGLDLEPVSEVPGYASHLRVSFVKIPECGTIQSLVVSSSFEDEERQGLIDSALNKYFGTDRVLSRGDVFRVCTEWNCGSSICVQCGQGLGSKEEDFIYFKVVAMEPSDERFLRVHHSQTALVLGGTVSCGLPPDLLVSSSKANMPLQVDTVNVLASVLSPPLCPSALSSKLRVAVLLHGLPGCGKRTVVNYVAKRLGLHVVEYSCHSLLASSEKKTSTALAQTFNMARRYAPTILLLRHFEVFKNLGSQDGSQGDRVGVASEIASIIRELTEPVSNGEYSSMEENSNSNSSVDEGGKFRGHQVLLIASSESTEGLSPTIRRCFSHEIRMGSLNDEQRSELLSQSLQDVSQLLNTSSDEFVKELVGQTSGFLPRDLRALVADAGANLFISKESETEKIDSLSGDVDQSSQLGNGSERLKAKDDFTKALDRSKKRNASALGAPKVPNVKWDDVGGLEDVKSSILDTVQLPLLHKDLFSSGLRKRSGVLLYGPPGTGKTLLAKAVATECSLNFLSVKGPELINMYIGESEKNVRDIFEKARSARPCVIFFDELDSLAPARGASGDSGGVMDRVVSQMLAEIDGLSDSSQDLFIIGASNRPDLIDPALLRPGRFDKLLYVGVNADASYRERVLKALTRKFKLSEDVSLYLVAKKCPSTFTGADMYALCADAWFQAAKRKAMVSFPFHKDQLLSPLSDDLIQLGKKGNIMKDALRCVKKEKLKYMPPPSNRLDGSHIVSDTDREVDKESCEELVSKTMKLPLLSCLSPSSIHRAKEIDKISDSYVEGTLRGMNNTDLDSALMGSKPELEDDVVAFPDQSVEGTESVNTRKDMEEGEHVDPVVKVSKTWNEEQMLKPKLPKAQKSRKSSSRNGLRGKDAAVNVVNTNVPDKLQEDIGDSGESKEQEQSSLVPKAKEEKLSEESAVKESFNGVRNVEEAWKCEPDSKHPIKWSDLNKDGNNTKESVRSEVTNKHSVEGGMKNVMEPERELSGTCKKPKTGKSRFSAVDQPGSNRTMKDVGKASPHEDRKRKQKENKESGDCMREAAVMEPSGEKVRKQKRLKGSSCEGKELPESCDRYRVVTQENGRDSASHQPLVHEAKRSLVDSLAPSALDPPELKSERISERDKPNDTDSSAGDTRKRCRDGEGYITMDKPGTTKKAAESLRDNKEGYCTESEPQQEKAKESRNKKRPARKVSMESNKEDSSREHQDPINKLENTNSTKTKVMRHDDHVGSSPLKKEITSQAASNSIKEATDLKHIADRLKNAGNNHESIGFYFQAALKFLHGASLLESSGTENATHKSIVTSKHIYGSTAKLCKFCAHEYEKDKDMGAAALAYKCMEVAYLRITYSSHGNINRYKSELEASLQVIPSGESPSFASDGENPNKTLAAEKVALSTPVRSSPKVTGNHVLSSGNHSSLSQLLTFSQNVSLAMDASRKAQTAFAVAKGKSSDTRYSSNGITCIKRALDFSFQDMEKLVHAVRLAMESINR
ncbi:unnamed protein product [Brassica napus]|uniref:Peroxisomal ATPase PEX6 n=1 Tax=Brassica napus TaxID=3708 RepID=A0A816PTN3_BRANA|nr:unnamed protein product [Brassica napus]